MFLYDFLSGKTTKQSIMEDLSDQFSSTDL